MIIEVKLYVGQIYKRLSGERFRGIGMSVKIMFRNCKAAV